MKRQPECSQQENDVLDITAVERVRKGDTSAFEEIVHRYTPLAYSLAYRLLGADRDLAEEAVQEIFLRVYGAMGKFNSERRFFTWFYTIALNYLRSQRRRRLAHPERKPISLDEARADPSQSQAAAQPEEQAISREGERLAQQALMVLPRHEREVFLLRHVEGLSGQEAADILGLPEATVRTHLFRARAHLKKTLLERQWE